MLNLAPSTGNPRSPADIQGSEAPAARNASPNIEIVAFKRNEYDRGSKKIIVDGKQWGWIEMIGHGCHGPTYHAHDMHGPVMVNRGEGWGRRKGEPIEHQFEPKGQRASRIENIGRSAAEQAKPVSTDEQLRKDVAELIAHGDLKAPGIRDQEIAKEQERYRRNVEASDRAAAEKLSTRAEHVLDRAVQVDGGLLFDDPEKLKAAIIEAMKWAQTQ